MVKRKFSEQSSHYVACPKGKFLVDRQLQRCCNSEKKRDRCVLVLGTDVIGRSDWVFPPAGTDCLAKSRFGLGSDKNRDVEAAETGIGRKGTIRPLGSFARGTIYRG
jgi:hypothetical protein